MIRAGSAKTSPIENSRRMIVSQLITFVSRFRSLVPPNSHSLDVWLNLRSSLVVAMGVTHLPFVLRHNSLTLNMLCENINLGRSEFPCGNASFEEQIELSIGSTLRLGNTEVGIDDAEEAKACPKETRVE